MNTHKMERALWAMATEIDGEHPIPTIEMKDVAELLRVLARMVAGRSAESAFGAPGDWGYGTPIGDALAERG